MKLSAVLGDITEADVDVIVNAANTSLLGGGGVDGAIHQKAGPALLEECREIRARQGASLPARHVVHTVGPTWVDGSHGEEAALRSAYLNSLRLADKHGAETIAFPNISTGVYRFPKELAAHVALSATKEYQSNTIKEVIFVCFDESNFQLYSELLR